jgi:Helix-turn-helix domain
VHGVDLAWRLVLDHEDLPSYRYIYTGIIITAWSGRHRARKRARGERLGMLLRQARGSRSMAEIAAASGVPVETLREIETGRIATPAFFTVAAR